MVRLIARAQYVIKQAAQLFCLVLMPVVAAQVLSIEFDVVDDVSLRDEPPCRLSIFHDSAGAVSQICLGLLHVLPAAFKEHSLDDVGAYFLSRKIKKLSRIEGSSFM